MQPLDHGFIGEEKKKSKSKEKSPQKKTKRGTAQIRGAERAVAVENEASTMMNAATDSLVSAYAAVLERSSLGFFEIPLIVFAKHFDIYPSLERAHNHRKRFVELVRD
jgi:hypothetical protein